MLGGDYDDQLIDNMSLTGWHSGYPDAPVRIDPNLARVLPFAQNTLLFLADFQDTAASLAKKDHS